MEGKEVRLGIHGSVLGEVVTFGGLGTGLYSIVMIALVAAFLGGLRVGPAGVPGKRIIAAGAPLTVLYALLTPALVLSGVALATNVPRRWLPITLIAFLNGPPELLSGWNQ